MTTRRLRRGLTIAALLALVPGLAELLSGHVLAWWEQLVAMLGLAAWILVANAWWACAQFWRHAAEQWENATGAWRNFAVVIDGLLGAGEAPKPGDHRAE